MYFRAVILIVCAALALGGLGWLLATGRAPVSPRDWHRTRFVMDMADIIEPDERARMASKIVAFGRDGGPEIIVATQRRLETGDFREDALRLGRSWAVGHEGNDDDGVILLIVQSEHAARIEAGFALLSRLSEAECRRIEARMAERLAAEDWTGAVRLGLDGILARLPAQRAPAR